MRRYTQVEQTGAAHRAPAGLVLRIWKTVLANPASVMISLEGPKLISIAKASRFSCMGDLQGLPQSETHRIDQRSAKILNTWFLDIYGQFYPNVSQTRSRNSPLLMEHSPAKSSKLSSGRFHSKPGHESTALQSAIMTSQWMSDISDFH